MHMGVPFHSPISIHFSNKVMGTKWKNMNWRKVITTYYLYSSRNEGVGNNSVDECTEDLMMDLLGQ